MFNFKAMILKMKNYSLTGKRINFVQERRFFLKVIILKKRCTTCLYFVRKLRALNLNFFLIIFG